MAGQVDWQPFFLNTDTPEEGEDLKEHITKKYGAEMARRFSGPDNPLAVAGQKVGISFNPARRVIPTGRCHVVMEHVNQTRGIEKGNDLMKVLFKMYAHSGTFPASRIIIALIALVRLRNGRMLGSRYFEEGLDVSRIPQLLVACTTVFGEASRAEFAALLQDDTKLAEQVREKDRAAKSRLRVSGVPFFIIGTATFSGAQPPEMLAEVLQEALD